MKWIAVANEVVKGQVSNDLFDPIVMGYLVLIFGAFWVVASVFYSFYAIANYIIINNKSYEKIKEEVLRIITKMELDKQHEEEMLCLLEKAKTVRTLLKWFKYIVYLHKIGFMYNKTNFLDIVNMGYAVFCKND